MYINKSVCILSLGKFVILFFYFRGERTEKKSDGDSQWVRRMIITVEMIGQGGNRAYKPVYKAVIKIVGVFFIGVSRNVIVVSGMNLQICFMNETASDTDSPNSDSEYPVTQTKPVTPPSNKPAKQAPPKTQRPASLSLAAPPLLQPVTQPMTEADFFARQARLQTEARMALAQAKEMAHMQMEVIISIRFNVFFYFDFLPVDGSDIEILLLFTNRKF